MYKSFRGKGNPGLKLLILLELRLDNVVFRSGFLPTIRASRQIINHRHVLVNGKRVDISSYILKPNETISFVKGTEINNIINTTKNNIKSLSVPSYLEIHKDKLSSNIVSVPVRDDIPVIINERLIVEYYSAK